MKLSEFVRLRNLLDLQSNDPTVDHAIDHLRGVVDAVSRHPVQIDNWSLMLNSDLANFVNSYNKLLSSHQALKEHLDTKINNRQTELLQDSLRLYHTEIIYEQPDFILQRTLKTSVHSSEDLRTLIRNLGDWRMPGMIIRPGLETFIEDMVPLDPLYVVDTHPDLIRPAMDKFTPQYQRRLRPYCINDFTSPQPLHELPDNQFALIFVYNFLNYRPIDVIQRYVADFEKKLRPGGHVIFTYNDCDYHQNVVGAEQGFMCYTPGTWISNICENVNLKVHQKTVPSYDLSWIHAVKPGTLESMRASQTVAKIESQ